MLRKVESLSKRQREITPWRFAVALVALARNLTCVNDSDILDVCFCCPGSPFKRMSGVRVWDQENPVPIEGLKGTRQYICFPPCGPWGKYSHVSKESKHWGRLAVAMVLEGGGLVEQPVGSQLFSLLPKKFVLRVRQGLLGHLAEKDTLIFWQPSPAVRRARMGSVAKSIPLFVQQTLFHRI